MIADFIWKQKLCFDYGNIFLLTKIWCCERDKIKCTFYNHYVMEMYLLHFFTFSMTG